MAAQGLGACFCPAMHLRDVRHLLEGPEPILRRLYVPDLDMRNELKLVTNRRMYHPRYLDVFAGILEEEARRAYSAERPIPGRTWDNGGSKAGPLRPNRAEGAALGVGSMNSKGKSKKEKTPG